MEAAMFNVDININVVSNPQLFDRKWKTTSESPPVDSSLKRRRCEVVKRVVKVAIKDMDEAQFNKQGEYCTNPPSDSWAWRKYGQKPIKGSPYPRGYYRCSSSKGCPARKQVERSRSDPSLLVITYSHDHNHSFPVPNSRSLKNPVKVLDNGNPSCLPVKAEDQDDKIADVAGDVESSLITTEDFGWSLSTDFETTSDLVFLEGLMFSGSGSGVDDDLAGCFPIGEEDEAFFDDLGELPECSVVFGTTTAATEEERLPMRDFPVTPPWCSTG